MLASNTCFESDLWLSLFSYRRICLLLIHESQFWRGRTGKKGDKHSCVVLIFTRIIYLFGILRSNHHWPSFKNRKFVLSQQSFPRLTPLGLSCCVNTIQKHGLSVDTGSQNGVWSSPRVLSLIHPVRLTSNRSMTLIDELQTIEWSKTKDRGAGRFATHYWRSRV